jgi:hypothetical protein
MRTARAALHGGERHRRQRRRSSLVSPLGFRGKPIATLLHGPSTSGIRTAGRPHALGPRTTRYRLRAPPSIMETRDIPAVRNPLG